jgi:hypothetical protein
MSEQEQCHPGPQDFIKDEHKRFGNNKKVYRKSKARAKAKAARKARSKA